MGNPRLTQMMIDLGLPKPDVSNPRARFYCTAAGWRRFGRILFSEARQLGHVMKMVSHRDPLPSQIVYEDKYQIADPATAGEEAAGEHAAALNFAFLFPSDYAGLFLTWPLAANSVLSRASGER